MQSKVYSMTIFDFSKAINQYLSKSNTQVRNFGNFAYCIALLNILCDTLQHATLREKYNHLQNGSFSSAHIIPICNFQV